MPKVAAAHIRLDAPQPRSGMYAAQKIWPCGDLPRSATPTVLTPGQRLTVEWVEGLHHPGWYRIVFSADGVTGFDDPATWLADGISDQPGAASYSVDVTLPPHACDQCVLQLVQAMTDKPQDPSTPSGYQEYYACADLVLVSASDGGPVGDGGGAGDPRSGEADQGDVDRGDVDRGDAAASNEPTTTTEAENSGGCSAVATSWLFAPALLLPGRRRRCGALA